MIKQLYHFTDLSGAISILQTNSMLSKSSAHWDYNRVSFTESESLWEHGDWRLTFSSEIIKKYGLKPMDYSVMTPQYSYEKEWYSRDSIVGVNAYVVDVSNTWEYILFDVSGWFTSETLGPLYTLGIAVVDNGWACIKNHMWSALVDFCRKNDNHLFTRPCTVFIDYDGEISIINKE